MAPEDTDALPLESTARLLARIRAGNEAARNQLLARCIPLLTRWAHRRLPHQSRELLDTNDVVQMTLIRSLNNLDSFEPRHEGAFMAYLRRISQNVICDEIRRVGRRPQSRPLDEAVPSIQPTPLEDAMGADALGRYERSLSRLTPMQQEALVLSIEFGCSPEEIAIATGRASTDAARVFIARALVRLAEEMGSNEQSRT